MAMQFLDTRFGLDQPVLPQFARYANGQLALTLLCPDGEPWLTVTSAVATSLPADAIAVKDWSENEGVPQLLIQAGLIEALALTRIKASFVEVPVYRLTAAARALVTP